MVQITLTNHNPSSRDQQVRIHINTGMCYFADNREMRLKHLRENPDFDHPLFREPVSLRADNHYHYEYDDIDQLFYAGIYVYAILIQTDKPLECTFKINPSSRFQYYKRTDPIYLSLNSHQTAEESISTQQLEGIISHLMGLKFNFSENTIIDIELSIKDLPEKVDADALYKHHDLWIALFKTPGSISSFELRYISPEIGFGVFSRSIINKGDYIGFYSGFKTNNNLYNPNYTFSPNDDCFALYVDSSQCGNITRFINHAPKDNTMPLLTANIKAESVYINGIEFICFIASTMILKGEQLLLDYGDSFFEQAPMSQFTKNGRIINRRKLWLWRHARIKINHIKVMAKYGVKRAQIYILVRIVIILSVLIGVISVFG